LEDTKEVKRRGRMLWLVAALFAAPLLLAMLLVSLGWHPLQTRNAGELLSPPIALEDMPPRAPDGSALSWAVGERGWSILVLAPDACAGDCAALYDSLHRVWLTQGRHADRVRVLWSGPLPADAVDYAGLQAASVPDALRARLPADATDGSTAARPVYLVDGRGFLALAYPQGFDPSGLRKDLARLLK